jgi:hypothetical protein
LDLPPQSLPSQEGNLTPPAVYGIAAGDIYPRTSRERDLCDAASRTDWVYLTALVAVDAAAIWAGSSEPIKYAESLPVRFSGPLMIGLAWGATVGGAWLALPKCSATWVGGPPREGEVRAMWPIALSLALLGGATAPVVNAIAVGYTLPDNWTTFEREMHLVTAGLAGFGGALLPYLLPPRTWAAAAELRRLRIGLDASGRPFVGYATSF